MFKAVNMRHSCCRHHLGNEKASEPEKKKRGNRLNFTDGGTMAMATTMQWQVNILHCCEEESCEVKESEKEPVNYANLSY